MSGNRSQDSAVVSWGQQYCPHCQLYGQNVLRCVGNTWFHIGCTGPTTSCCDIHNGRCRIHKKKLLEPKIILSHETANGKRNYKIAFVNSKVNELIKEEEAEHAIPYLLVEYLGKKKIALQRHIRESIANGEIAEAKKLETAAKDAEEQRKQGQRNYWNKNENNGNCPGCDKDINRKNIRSNKCDWCDLWYCTRCEPRRGESSFKCSTCSGKSGKRWTADRISRQMEISSIIFYKIDWHGYSTGRFDWKDEEELKAMKLGRHLKAFKRQQAQHQQPAGSRKRRVIGELSRHSSSAPKKRKATGALQKRRATDDSALNLDNAPKKRKISEAQEIIETKMDTSQPQQQKASNTSIRASAKRRVNDELASGSVSKRMKTTEEADSPETTNHVNEGQLRAYGEVVADPNIDEEYNEDMNENFEQDGNAIEPTDADKAEREEDSSDIVEMTDETMEEILQIEFFAAVLQQFPEDRLQLAEELWQFKKENANNTKAIIKKILLCCYNRHAKYEDGRVSRKDKALSYGEISFEMLDILLDKAEIADDDTFADVGSGVGQLVLYVAATRNVKKSIGIEKIKTRLEAGKKIHAEFKKWMDIFNFPMSDVEFHEKDLLEDYKVIEKDQIILPKLKEAQVIFTDNYVFGPELNDVLFDQYFKHLEEGARIISTDSYTLPGANRRKKPTQTLGQNTIEIEHIINAKNVDCFVSKVRTKIVPPIENSFSWGNNLGSINFCIYTIDSTKVLAYKQAQQQKINRRQR